MGSVSSYDGQSFKMIDTEKKDVFNDETKIKDANNWQNSNNKIIITPVGSLDELEQQWRDFNSMIKKHRRESDWKCIEIFGMTNQDVYDKLKSSFLSDNIKRYDDYESIDAYLQAEDEPITESFAMDSDIDSIASYYDTDHSNISYTNDAVSKAKEWSIIYNRFMIMPVKSLVDLEALWDAYSSMIHKHKRESDWKSIELFGMNNLDHYKKLKADLLKNDISEEDQTLYDDLVSESVTVYDSPKMITKYLVEASKTSSKINIAKCMLEQYSKNNTVYDEILTINGITEIIDNCDDLITSNAEIGVEYGELPYYSPEEMIDMGVFGQASVNYYGERADNESLSKDVTTLEWFKAYKESTINSEKFISYIPDWIDKVRSLYHEFCNSINNNDNQSIINRKRQSLLELGWNPDVDFSDRSRAIVRDINSDRETFTTEFIDLREFVSSSNKSVEDDIKPVYVVLSEGKRIISGIIKNVTKDKYSHISISFDPNLKTMYSFADNGITVENVDDIKEACRIRVFAFFVKSDIYSKIRNNVNYYLENKELTHYSYLNLFTFLFNVNYEKEWKLICSQFVDKVLKMADLDLTNKQSALTSPSTFNHSLKDKRNVYTLYAGLAKDYDGSRIYSLINGLRSKAIVLESSKVFFDDEYTYLRTVISNINNIDKLNILKEYSSLVSNEKIKTILEKYVFIDIKSYYDESESEDNSSINRLNSLIEKYVRPL